jgi:hypothetical protein
MLCIKSVSWFEKFESTEACIVSFRSGNSYECYMSVDEVMVLSHSPIILNIYEENNQYDKEVKEEVAWCDENFMMLREIYRNVRKYKSDREKTPEGEKNFESDK